MHGTPKVTFLKKARAPRPAKTSWFRSIFTAVAMLSTYPAVTGDADMLLPPAEAMARMAGEAWHPNVLNGVRNDPVYAQYVLTHAYQHAPELVSAYYTRFGNEVARHCASGFITSLVPKGTSNEFFSRGEIAGCPQIRQEKIHDVQATYTQDKNYKAWDDAGRERYKRYITNDPLLIEARRHWHTQPGHDGYMNTKARARAFQRMLDLHALAYTDGVFKPKAARLSLRNIADPTAGAYYLTESHTVIMRERSMYELTFPKIGEFATHEARHALERELFYGLKIRAYKKYYEEKGIQHAANIFRVAWEQLFLNSDEPKMKELLYRSRPTEVNAYLHENDGHVAGTGTNTPRPGGRTNRIIYRLTR